LVDSTKLYNMGMPELEQMAADAGSVAMKITGHKTREIFALQHHQRAGPRRGRAEGRDLETYMDELNKRQVKEQPPVAPAPIAAKRLIQ
jgi:hypothetical protein